MDLDNDQAAYLPERVQAALRMNLDFIDVTDVDGGEDCDTEIIFSDDTTHVDLWESELLSYPELAPFLKEWTAYCEAGSELAAEIAAERRAFACDL